MDSPEWMHRLAAFLRDGVLRAHEQAETAGDWGLSASENQAMPYARELDDPAANVNGVSRRRLWGYMATQEFTLKDIDTVQNDPRRLVEWAQIVREVVEESA